ncbi:GntR family transcriptional regulator [Microvirga sp. TS319]|uniref:GntR family transcriptional regulator n=1 Tax=Microvirga sp. TS319 TaxID=3241165 RepID=UPI00351A3DA3
MKQQTLVMLRIREMILQGELKPGERVPEAVIAERLGISRTPVRQALPALAQEGLLVAGGARGYVVRGFTAQEILDAIEVRAALEGFAARAIAERGPTRALLRAFRACLDEGDAIFEKRRLTEDDELQYGRMNGTFHALILEGAEKAIVSDLAARCQLVPFTSPSAIAFDKAELGRMFEVLFYAHRQHHAIVNAIEQRDGWRVDFLLKEHANPQKQSMNLPEWRLSAGSRLGDPAGSEGAQASQTAIAKLVPNY